MINIGPALHLGFALLLLWGLIVFCWKELLLDSLRNRLFALRYRLFMYAASNDLPFDHPTYRTLRELINGMIRFAHKITFTRLLLAMVAQTLHPDPRFMEPMQQWREAVKKLPEQSENALTSIHDDMFRVVMKHMALANPLLLIAFALLLAIRILVNVITRGATQNLTILKAGRDLQLNLIEAQALEARELESVYGDYGLARV